jgi:uncharacterized membrane protein
MGMALDPRRIRQEIEAAEVGTTGRIGVRVVPEAASDALEIARKCFHDAGMHQLPDQNAVIFLIAPSVRKFAVYGGGAVHERLPATFWSQLVLDMQRYFANDRPDDALALGIGRIGEELRYHFPARARRRSAT